MAAKHNAIIIPVSAVGWVSAGQYIHGLWKVLKYILVHQDYLSMTGILTRRAIGVCLQGKAGLLRGRQPQRLLGSALRLPEADPSPPFVAIFL
jgi:hypothetical protein